ncbi:MAG: KH domain-containing protein [Firmicutes bacterium]|jgi:predicted RNA-binding protein YlqC (UPF0109 family)|nr:KH domain-containing protein [Bacillota bacterium]
MRELVEVLTKALVDHPEMVEVREVEGETSVVIEIKVAPDDVGKVVGRQGRIARALRSVVRALAAREAKRASVEILS